MKNKSINKNTTTSNKYWFEEEQVCDNCNKTIIPTISTKRCGEPGYRETCYKSTCANCGNVIHEDYEYSLAF